MAHVNVLNRLYIYIYTVKLGYIKLGFYEYMVYIKVLSRPELNPIYLPYYRSFVMPMKWTFKDNIRVLLYIIYTYMYMYLFFDNVSISAEVVRVFGKSMLEYLKGLANGHIDYLPRLPHPVLANIIRHIELEDISRLSLVSKLFWQVNTPPHALLAGKYTPTSSSGR